MLKRDPRKSPPFKLNPQRIAYIKYQQYLLSMKRVIDSEAKKIQKSSSLKRSIRISSEATQAARQGFNDTQAPAIPYLLPDTCNHVILSVSQRQLLEQLLR